MVGFQVLGFSPHTHWEVRESDFQSPFQPKPFHESMFPLSPGALKCPETLRICRIAHGGSKASPGLKSPQLKLLTKLPPGQEPPQTRQGLGKVGVGYQSHISPRFIITSFQEEAAPNHSLLHPKVPSCTVGSTKTGFWEAKIYFKKNK